MRSKDGLRLEAPKGDTAKAAKMRRSESEYEFQRLMNMKWALMLIDAFVFVAALANFGICLWIRFDLDFKEWVREMDW